MQPENNDETRMNMGIFGIYALICTFLLLAYYTVTIWFDLRGSKGTSKDETETIAAGDMTDTEASTDVRELDGGGYLLDAAACDDEPEPLKDVEDIVSGEEEANGQPSELSVTDGLDGTTVPDLSAGQSPEENAEEHHDAPEPSVYDRALKAYSEKCSPIERGYEEKVDGSVLLSQLTSSIGSQCRIHRHRLVY